MERNSWMKYNRLGWIPPVSNILFTCSRFSLPAFYIDGFLFFHFILFIFFFFWWILLFLVRKRRKQATCGCVSDVSGGWKKDVNEGSLTKQSSTSSSALLLIASFFNVSPRCFIIKRYPQQLQCLLASFFSLAFV